MILPWKGTSPTIGKNVFIAPNATVIGDVVLEDEVTILFGAVVRGDILPIRIGKRSNVQDGCVLHTSRKQEPLIIGEDVTIGHGAVLHSAKVEDRCLIGMGATIIDNSVIGSDSIVGAGSLVTKGKTFPAGSMILGSPAKVVRETTAEEKAFLPQTAKNYVGVGAEYASIISKQKDQK